MLLQFVEYKQTKPNKYRYSDFKYATLHYRIEVSKNVTKRD